MSEDDPLTPDAFNEDLSSLIEGIKSGKKPTLADLLLYQRVLNYNTVIIYKNMVRFMEAIKMLDGRLDGIEKGQEDIFLQIQEFLDAHNMIKGIELPPEDDPKKEL